MDTNEIEARFYELNNDIIRCTLCPHYCQIQNHAISFCKVRRNENMKMILPFAGRLSSFAVDPVEKKPLYHFFPGEKTYSAGFWSCNMTCPFCQNYTISAQTSKTQYYSPNRIVKDCINRDIKFLSFTYSEPVIHYEWIYETALIAHKNGIKTILVSNGLLNEGPAEELSSVIDAANIDLKTFNKKNYKTILQGNLETTMNTIKIFSQKHLEITSLIVPEINDDEADFEHMSQWIASINPLIPLHLTMYHPDYKYMRASCSPEFLYRIRHLCQKNLKFVYTGNTGQTEDTYCYQCGKKTVSKRGSLKPEFFIKNGHCENCGADQYIQHVL